MKKQTTFFLLATALVTSACGKSVAEPAPEAKMESAKLQTASLPADPVERATTCQAALMAPVFEPERYGRRITEQELLPMVHPAYLVATAGGGFDGAIMERVSTSGTTLAKQYAEKGGYQAIAAECGNAYPESRPGSFRGLPENHVQSSAVCFALATAVLETYDISSGINSENKPVYERLAGKLQDDVIERIVRQGAGDTEAVKQKVGAALGMGMRSGPPAEVLNACRQKYDA